MHRNLKTVPTSRRRSPFTEGQIRWFIFNAQSNGLASAAAVVRAGRRVYLDVDKFETGSMRQNRQPVQAGVTAVIPARTLYAWSSLLATAAAEIREPLVSSDGCGYRTSRKFGPTRHANEGPGYLAAARGRIAPHGAQTGVAWKRGRCPPHRFPAGSAFRRSRFWLITRLGCCDWIGARVRIGGRRAEEAIHSFAIFVLRMRSTCIPKHPGRFHDAR